MLNKDIIKGWGALPPAEMKEKVQREFAAEYDQQRAAADARITNHAIVVGIINTDPDMWAAYGLIGSYTQARNVLERYATTWSKGEI